MSSLRPPGIPLLLLLTLTASARAAAGEGAPRIDLEGAELTATPGTLGDPFRVVMTLPGMGDLASGLGYPVFRGREPATTGFFLDGVRVPVLYHLLVGPSVVHPDFLGSIEVHRSAPVDRGRLMGAVVDAKPRPATDRPRGTATLDLLNLGLLAQVPLPDSGTEITAAARLAYSPLLYAAFANARPPPADRPRSTLLLDVYDYQARVVQRVGSGSLRLLAFGSSDVAGVRSEAESGRAFLHAHRLDLRYRQPLGAGEVEVGATYGWDRLGIAEVGGASAKLDLALTERTTATRLAWSARLDAALSVVVGADLERRQSDFSQTATVRPGPVEDPDRPTLTTGFRNPVATVTMIGAYARASWTGLPGWTLEPGLRVENLHLVPGVDRPAVEPRLLARRAFGPVVLTGSAGLFHQPPTSLLPLPTTEAAGLRYGLQEGARFDLQATWRPFDAVELTAGAYVDPLLRTVELSLTDTDFLEADPAEVLRLRESRGNAYGLEVMVRRRLRSGAFGWLSYSLQRSLRRTRFLHRNAYGEPVQEAIGDLPYHLDRTHVLNAVVSQPLPGGWTLGLGFHLRSGIPEAGGLTSVTSRHGVGRDGFPRWVQHDLDLVERLPPFSRLDARIAKAWSFQAFSLEAYLDVQNVFLSRETLRHTYEVQARTNEELLAGRARLVKTPSSSLPVPTTVPLLGLEATY